jgi:hypothetical protein
MSQTGSQVLCEQTGKMKNCGVWAAYEEGFSGSAAMCNGGLYDGDSYEACPSRNDCFRATKEKEDSGRRHLPVNMGRPLGATQIIGQTPAARPSQPGTRPRAAWEDAYERWRGTPPTSLPARTSGMAPAQPAGGGGSLNYPSSPYPAYVPTPIQPPQQFPPSMQTPFAAPVPFHAGGITPTFLPVGDESIWTRLGKNIGQGMVGSFGWQIFDFARTVDMFGRKK